MDDVLVIGAGPAGLAIAAALGRAGLKVGGLAAKGPAVPWTPTYGIWVDELAAISTPANLLAALGPRWADTWAYAAGKAIPLQREYGLFSNPRFQALLLAEGERERVTWHTGLAAKVEHAQAHSTVRLKQGGELSARLVIDASGHTPALVSRVSHPAADKVAYQTAYGIVGSFNRPPVQPGQLVLMDYRAGHLDPEERKGPPTFLYAMHLGQGRYFVEETSPAHRPPVSFDLLQKRLYARLAFHGYQVIKTEHIEQVSIPMNQPLPNLRQRVLGYGGAASLVHPGSGYQINAALRRAEETAGAVARALGREGASPRLAAWAGWRALWPGERIRCHNLYLFGLETLLGLNEASLQAFYATFFQLPHLVWSGYLSDSLSTRQVLWAMLRLFRRYPAPLRRNLLQAGRGHAWLLLMNL